MFVHLYGNATDHDLHDPRMANQGYLMNPRKLIIATPVYGHPDTATVHAGYHREVRKLERAGAVLVPMEMLYADDIARARSRCVRFALGQDFDWLMFWDSDVVPSDDTIIPRMIELAEHDAHAWIGAPYPRKRIPTLYPYRPIDPEGGRLEIVRDCIEVAGLAIGFTLIHRTCLAQMVERYREELWYSDWTTTEHTETVGIFNFLTTDTTDRNGHRWREMLGEDYAGCHRWRAMGGKVQMYVGQGSPVAHVGDYVFRGRVEEIGQCL